MFWPYITSLMIIVRISKPKQMAYTGKWTPASFLAKTSCKYKMIVLTTVRGGGTKSRKCHVFFYSFWWILNILQTRDASSCKKKNFIEIIFLLKSILVWKVCLKKLPTLKIAFAVSKYKPVLAQPPVKSTPFTRLSFCNATPNKQA